MMGTTPPSYVTHTLVFLLLLGNGDVFGLIWNKEKGKVLPRDPKIWAGDNLTLECNLTDTDIPLESKTLYFKRKNTPVPEKYIYRTENKRHIKLKLPNIQNDDEATYYCYLNETSIGSQYVTVYSKPVPVENLSCLVYDWSWMRCSWDLDAYFHYPYINVTLVWVIDAPNSGQYECPHLKNTSCTWKENGGLDSFKPDMAYYILVIVRNIVMKNYTANVKQRIDTTTIVKPAPVNNLVSSATNSTCLEVTWGNGKPERVKSCVISLHSKFQKVDKTLITDSRPTQMTTVCGLHPYAKYHINVRCQPYIPQGHYSDETVTETVMPEDVPSSAPVLCVGCYRVELIQDNPVMKKVTVYWKPIPEVNRNGQIVSYEITYNGESRSVIDVENNQGSVNLRSDQDYEITVQARTIGLSQPSHPIYVKLKSTRPGKPAVFYVVRDEVINGSSTFMVKFTWEKPQSEWDSVTGYTLYYCQGLRFKCRGMNSSVNSDLAWLHLSPNETSYTMTLPGNAEEYIFGISADTTAFSSGLLWSSCTYFRNQAPVKAPRSFKFAEVKGDLSLTVNWEKYLCVESSPVLRYNLRYCPVETTTEEPNCIVPIQVQEVLADQSSYTLYKLEAGRTYAVSLQAETTGGLGPETHWIFASAITIATRLSPGEIAGIIICCLFVLSFALVGFVVFVRRMKRLKELPKDSFIMPPPLPDPYRFDSYTEGSHQYAICSSPESPTSRTSLLSNGNSSPISNGSDSSGLTDETPQVFVIPKSCGNGFISNGSARSLDKIKLPEKKNAKKQKNPIPEGYIRVANLSIGLTCSNASQTLPNNMFSPRVKSDKDAVVMFTVADGKLKPSDQIVSPVNGLSQNQKNYIETRGMRENGLDSRASSQSSPFGSTNQIGSYTRFTDGFSSNCIGSAISLASSGGVLRHSPPPEQCVSTDQELSDYEQPVRGPLTTSTPISTLPYVRNRCHQSADSELNQSYLQSPALCLDSRSLPSILECVDSSNYTKNTSDGESTLSVCSESAESLHFSETENSDHKSASPTLITNYNGYVTQIDGSSSSDNLGNKSEQTVVPSSGHNENNFLCPVSSSFGYVSNIPVSDSPVDSTPTECPDTQLSPVGNVPNDSADSMPTSSNCMLNNTTVPTVSASGYVPNNTVSVSEPHDLSGKGYVSNNSVSDPQDLSGTGYISNNTVSVSEPLGRSGAGYVPNNTVPVSGPQDLSGTGYVLNNVVSVSDPEVVSSTGYVSNVPIVEGHSALDNSPDGDVSDSGLDNSLCDVVSLSSHDKDTSPVNLSLSQDTSNTVVSPSYGYIPNNSVSPQEAGDLPRIVEPDVEHEMEIFDDVEPSGLRVIDGYLRLPDTTVGHSNTDDTLSSTPISMFNSRSDLSKLSCSSVVRPISSYMKDLPVQYFYDPQAKEDLPTTEL